MDSRKPLTAGEIEELRELEAKATQGEWRVIEIDYEGDGCSWNVYVPAGQHQIPVLNDIGNPRNAALIAAMRNALPALLAELEKLRGVSCAICHDTGYLDASQGWDVGQEASECPYCPARVDALRARLEVLEKEKARLRLALATVAHNTMDPCITGIAVNALEETR